MTDIFENSETGAMTIPPKASMAVDSESLSWRSCGAEGFWIKPLLEDRCAGIRTWLMKMDAGAFSDLHAHNEVEQIYVLEGSFYDREQTYGPGTFLVRDAGALHIAGSENGAVMLLVYSVASPA